MAIAALVAGLSCRAPSLEQAEWEPPHRFDLGWRSRDFSGFLEFTLPGSTPCPTANG